MIVAKDVVVTKDLEFVVDKESEEINVVKGVIIISTVVKDLDMINECFLVMNNFKCLDNKEVEDDNIKLSKLMKKSMKKGINRNYTTGYS